MLQGMLKICHDPLRNVGSGSLALGNLTSGSNVDVVVATQGELAVETLADNAQAPLRGGSALVRSA